MIWVILAALAGMYFAWFMVPQPPIWITKLNNAFMQWINSK